MTTPTIITELESIITSCNGMMWEKSHCDFQEDAKQFVISLELKSVEELHICYDKIRDLCQKHAKTLADYNVSVYFFVDHDVENYRVYALCSKDDIMNGSNSLGRLGGSNFDRWSKQNIQIFS